MFAVAEARLVLAEVICKSSRLNTSVAYGIMTYSSTQPPGTSSSSTQTCPETALEPSCSKVETPLRSWTFESRRMTPTEQGYSAQEREMLAVAYALQKWRGYIEGSPVLVRTDHESLKHFFDVEIIYVKHLDDRLLGSMGDDVRNGPV